VEKPAFILLKQTLANITALRLSWSRVPNSAEQFNSRFESICRFVSGESIRIDSFSKKNRNFESPSSCFLTYCVKRNLQHLCDYHVQDKV